MVVVVEQDSRLEMGLNITANCERCHRKEMSVVTGLLFFRENYIDYDNGIKTPKSYFFTIFFQYYFFVFNHTGTENIQVNNTHQASNSKQCAKIQI